MTEVPARAFTIARLTPGLIESAVPVFDAYRVFYGKESDPASCRQFLEDRIGNGESVAFVAQAAPPGRDARGVGFMQLYPSYSSISLQKIWILNDLYVDDAFRNKGVARKLIARAVDLARSSNAKRLELATARDNYIAQGLYASLNFSREDEFYHYFLPV